MYCFIFFQGVVTAATSLITTLAQKNPEEFKTSVSLAVSRLSRVSPMLILIILHYCLIYSAFEVKLSYCFLYVQLSRSDQSSVPLKVKMIQFRFIQLVQLISFNTCCLPEWKAISLPKHSWCSPCYAASLCSKKMSFS